MTWRVMGRNYERCVRRNVKGDEVTIVCRLGLWSVHGPISMMHDIEREALRYWVQYRADGEYNELIRREAATSGDTD